MEKLVQLIHNVSQICVDSRMDSIYVQAILPQDHKKVKQEMFANMVENVKQDSACITLVKDQTESTDVHAKCLFTIRAVTLSSMKI